MDGGRTGTDSWAQLSFSFSTSQAFRNEIKPLGKKLV